MIENKISDFSRICKYLQLGKPLGFEIEKLIQNQLAINLLKGMAKRTPLGLTGLKGHLGSLEVLRNSFIYKTSKVIYHQNIWKKEKKKKNGNIFK